MEEYLVELRTVIWRTAGARYNAARRLKRKELFSTISLTFFSVISICLAVVQKVYAPAITKSTGLDDYITTLSILSGIFLLAISLMEWGARNGSNADALYKNAEDLNSLQRKIKQELFKVGSGSVTWERCGAISAEYDAVQSRCDINHDPIDDQRFIADYRSAPEFVHKNISSKRALRIRILWFFSSVWYYLIFWLISLFALLPVFSRIEFMTPA
ncbi:SLATT domain-containing protein [Pseudomonas sp. B2M1-30]|uniref:SLATT domain-containing protein n=1 Tax=Pseudomonas TaxID=286 RepID=UPI0021C8031D|nr:MULTISPECIES: SLATT domain-containing protein [Pseudomonas]MCU0117450.1 SLATT domain-containing protein [Pseudomonas sp. B2M1-30]MCU7258986.1 SLATT domain-containing protein [Pseudomonas koreensis]